VGDMTRLESREQMMVRRMFGVHLKSRTASAELNSPVDCIECITVMVYVEDCGRLVI